MLQRFHWVASCPWDFSRGFFFFFFKCIELTQVMVGYIGTVKLAGNLEKM